MSQIANVLGIQKKGGGAAAAVQDNEEYNDIANDQDAYMEAENPGNEEME